MSNIDNINNEILNLKKSGTSVKNISDGNQKNTLMKKMIQCLMVALLSV